MLAIVLSTALLAMSPQSPASASAPLGYSQGTTQLLEKIDSGTLRPIRHRRPLTIGAEIGYNGLGGTGLNMSYNLNPHFSLDAGAGLGLPGLRTGLRGRYNLLTSNWTPFVGLGVNYLYAAKSDTAFEERSTNNYSIKVSNSPFASGTVGMSYQGPHGFAFLASLGYSQLLSDKSNVTITRGHATKDDRRVLDMLVGSGPIASVMFGYSF